MVLSIDQCVDWSNPRDGVRGELSPERAWWLPPRLCPRPGEAWAVWCACDLDGVLDMLCVCRKMAFVRLFAVVYADASSKLRTTCSGRGLAAAPEIQLGEGALVLCSRSELMRHEQSGKLRSGIMSTRLVHEEMKVRQ